ncbi:MAG: class I SAM-dependent methyltransferase [Bacteroidetes bacterium]|nr:class I SAM-dependent methyltransferase [Bacteroidota bacterium]
MKRLIREVNSFIKGFILLIRPGVYLGFLRGPFLFLSNLLKLTKWINNQSKDLVINDFYKAVRNFNDRFNLYQAIADKENLREPAISYLEFGVYGGTSFDWWLKANKNPDSKYYGFDTFEGLPEQWGTYRKGDMLSDLPYFEGYRHILVKGLFQETLFDFVKQNDICDKRKVIMLDADLFSSTLFVLTTLAPYLKKDDIIFFDEFNVPNHEFFAFNIFRESYYTKFELLGAVNNYYQVAFKVL